MIDYLFSGDFRKIKEKLEKEMKSCGFLEAYDVPMKDGSLAYNLNLNIGPSSLGIDEIDLFIKTEGSFFYGSPFSLTFEPIDVLWPRYSVCIQTAHLKTVEELKEHVCTLKLLLTKVSKMFSEKE